MNSSLRNMLDSLTEAYQLPIDIDEILEEDNVTSNLDGGEGQLNTPFAFSKKVKDPDDLSYSEPVHHTEKFYKKFESIQANLEDKIARLNERSYQDFKQDDSKNEKEKINGHIIEINRKLREVEQMINHASKLKLETGADHGIFWKGTIGNFLKIREKLTRLSNKIVEFSS